MQQRLQEKVQKGILVDVYKRQEGERPLIFDSVVVRVREDFDLDMHLDTDEANAAGLRQGDTVTVVDRATAEAIRKA